MAYADSYYFCCVCKCVSLVLTMFLVCWKVQIYSEHFAQVEWLRIMQNLQIKELKILLSRYPVAFSRDWQAA